MSKTNIEWSHAPGFDGETWNPTLGCDKVSKGCRGCYAIRSVWRMAHNPNAKIAAANAGLVVMTGAGLNWTGKVNSLPDRLSVPLKKNKPTCWFVNSLSDLFHDEITDHFLDAVFATMSLCPQHRFMILTKRPDRMRRYLTIAQQSSLPGNTHCFTNKLPLPNVWLGVSCEDQPTADERIPLLQQTPAAVRFISAEPLLGPIEFTGLIDGISQIICGGESGPDARPFNLEWALSIRDQCAVSNTAYFFKQAGANVVTSRCGLVADTHFPNNPRMETIPHESSSLYRVYLKDKKGGDLSELPTGLQIREFPR